MGAKPRLSTVNQREICYNLFLVGSGGDDDGKRALQRQSHVAVARAPSSFKQADLVRAVKAVQACGLDIVRTEISPDGRIIIHHHGTEISKSEDEFEAWRARRDARSVKGH
ncbi:MAG: hypothetical protein KGJ57_00100 [Sphingomonadales bacterium]|nr:hypothetical protein [Sphingomonadales bacterium]MDE2167809.1 hypothetical protein [Sphingomonadales bacterium]